MAEEKKVKFLVVDDSEFMRTIITRIITKCCNSDIHPASSGNDAIEMYRLSKPDIVFLDINMSDGDGFDLLRKIRKEEHKAKCVVVSAIDQKEVTQEAEKLGAIDFVHKPFEEDRVIKAVNKALGKEVNQDGKDEQA